ncbi:MAG: PAS domain S-box protein [Spirochaetia bacterium]
MKKWSFENRVATIIDAVGKTSPTDASIGIPRSSRHDELDLLVDAIEDLLRRSREGVTALQSAQDAMMRLQVASDTKAEDEPSREHILLLNALKENIPDTIYFKDAQGRFLHLSKAHVRAFNLISTREVVGMTDFDFFTDEHARAAFEDEQRIIHTGEPIIDREEKETWLDRPATWVLTTKMPLRDAQGNIVGTFGISRDITERKRVEEALGKSEERYRLLFNSINDAVFVHGLTADGLPGKITEVNDVACERLGYSREELLQMRPLDFDTFESAAIAPEMAVRLKAEKHAVWEGVNVSKAGLRIPVEISAHLFDIAGEPTIIATVRDISARTQLEENLAKEKALLLTLIDNLPDYVSVKNGLERAQEAVGKTDLDFYPPSEAARYMADERTIIQTGTALINKEEESSDREGHNRWTLTTKVPLRDAQGNVTGVVCAGRDITEHKRAETENARMNRALRMLSDSNQALIHTTDETSLLNETCRIAVDVGGYRMARVEFAEHDEAKTLRPVAHAGFESGYIESANATWTWADTERGRGPGGTAIRTGQPCIARNIELDPAFAPWRETAIQRGYKSVIALPLISEGETLGTLGIYSAEIDAFDAKEVDILKELAGDLAFGITALRTRAKRDQAEEALRESEKRYRLIAENTADTIAIFDLDLRTTYVSPSVQKLIGFTVQETLERSLDQILTPESLQKAYTAFAEQIELEKTGQQDPSRTVLLELEVYCKAGSTLWVELVVSSLRDNNLKPTGLLTVTRDITKRRQAEAARQLLASAIEQAAETIVITDAAATIEYVNPAFEAVTGYAREEVVGRNPRILKSGEQDAAFYASLWDAISNGRTWTGRLVNRKKDGTRFIENATISPVFDSAGAIVKYVAVKHDVTRERQLEDQLRQVQKMESVGRLTGGVAHDFNNILQAITGYCDLLKAGVSDENQQYVEEITKAAERATTLTAQLLAFSRRQILRPRVVETKDLIRSMQKMLERVIGEDIELRTLIDPDTGNFLADPGRMEQVLLNLAINARDAMPSGGKLTLETSNRAFDAEYVRDHPGVKAGQYVRIAVSDTGVGMDQETLSHIFEPFFTTKEMGKGTGLGLSTVYGIVKQSEGYINCYSEKGRGTTFTIHLPLTLEEADNPLVAGQGTTAPRGTETILLVDDDSAVRSVARIAMEEAGYVVIEASGGEEALRDVRAHNLTIELLVTDVVMPRMSGKELAQKLGEMCPGVRVLYVSGYTANVISHHGVLDPGLDYMEKPFGSRELLTKVREILDRP